MVQVTKGHKILQGQLIESTLTSVTDGGHNISCSNFGGCKGNIRTSCEMDLQLYRIVSDISTLLNGSNSPWQGTERLFPSAVQAAQVSTGY